MRLLLIAAVIASAVLLAISLAAAAPSGKRIDGVNVAGRGQPSQTRRRRSDARSPKGSSRAVTTPIHSRSGSSESPEAMLDQLSLRDRRNSDRRELSRAEWRASLDDGSGKYDEVVNLIGFLIRPPEWWLKRYPSGPLRKEYDELQADLHDEKIGRRIIELWWPVLTQFNKYVRRIDGPDGEIATFCRTTFLNNSVALESRTRVRIEFKTYVKGSRNVVKCSDYLLMATDLTSHDSRRPRLHAEIDATARPNGVGDEWQDRDLDVIYAFSSWAKSVGHNRAAEALRGHAKYEFDDTDSYYEGGEVDIL